MNEFTFIHLSDLYEAERKALIKAATDYSGQEFSLGIIALVEEIENQIRDKESENAKPRTTD